MILFILFALVSVLYVLVPYVRLLYYWKKRGVKSVTPLPVVGNLLPIVLETKSLSEYIVSLYNAYPNERYCGIFQFGMPLLMIRDPELIKTITIKEFNSFTDHGTDFDESQDPMWEKNLFAVQGARWKSLRQTLSPVFTSKKMKTMYVLMEDNTHRIINHLNSKDGQIIELELINLIKRFLMDIIATTAFGLEINSLTDEDNEFFKIGTELTDFSGLKRFNFLLYNSINPLLSKLLNVKMVNTNVSNFYHSIMKNTMEVRARENIIRPDLVHLLMEARKGQLLAEDVGSSPPTNGSSSATNQKQFALNLTDEDITAQAVIFIFGGYDTTAKLLSFCAYELAINPLVQDKLREEVDANFRKFNGKIGYEDLFSMKYMDLVISETLRMWPPGMFVDRKAVSPVTIEPERKGENALHIQRGDIMFIPVFALQRDPKYWSNPDTFDPERFNEENKGKIVSGTYLPFGLGPRNCIGTRYATMVARLFIFHLLANFEIVPTAKSKIPLDICRNNILILPEHGFWFGLKKRKNLKKTD